MSRVISVFLVMCLVVTVVVSARQGYRPSNLADMVEAVGTNSDGLPEDDLPRRVSTFALHILHIGDAIGVAVRFGEDVDDVESPVFVGWRMPGQLWRSAMLDHDETVEGGRLGRLSSLRPAGELLLLETHLPASSSTVVLRRDVTTVARVAGVSRLILPSGLIVFERIRGQTGPARSVELVLLEARGTGAPQVSTLFPTDTNRGAGSATMFSSLRFDEGTDTLTFTAAFMPGAPTVAVTCRPMSQSTRTCV